MTLSSVQQWLRQQKAEYAKENTVGWLIERAEQDPSLLWRAHRKLYQAFAFPLPKESEPTALCELEDLAMHQLYHDQPRKMQIYPAFKNFHGIEEPLARFGEHFRLASLGMEEERQILWLYGPHSSGKTTLLETILKRMEKLSFWALAHCSHNQHPLHVVPEEEREFLCKTFYWFRGAPCKKCGEELAELKGEWWNMPVHEIPYSFSSARGIAFMERPFVPPSTMGKYPDEWHTILTKEANGGVLVIGFIKQDQPAELRALLADMVQSQRMNEPESSAQVSLDFVIIAVSNESLKDYTGIRKDTAFFDRAIQRSIPAVVSPSAEQNIHRQLSQYINSNAPFHFMPHVERCLNIMACASRLYLTYNTTFEQVVDRLSLYDGDSLPARKTGKEGKEVQFDFFPPSYRHLKSEQKGDGFEPGLSVRACQKIRGLARRDRDHCITFFNMKDALQERLGKEELDAAKKSVLGDALGEKDKKPCLLELHWQQLLIRDLVMAWVGRERFREDLEANFKKYIDYAVAAVSERPFIDEKREEAFDEKVLQKVEEEFGIIGSSAKKFREDVVNREGMIRRLRGCDPLLRDFPVLKECIARNLSSAPLKELNALFSTSPTQDFSKPVDFVRLQEKLIKAKKELSFLDYKDCCIEWLFGSNANESRGGYLYIHRSYLFG